MTSQPWTIRRVYPSDLDFIIDTWTRSYRERGKLCPYIIEGLFFHEHSNLIRQIFGRAETFVACDKDDDEMIIGYIVAAPGMTDVLHYVYVKKAFRRMGVTRSLLEKVKQGEMAVNTHENVPKGLLKLIQDKYKSVSFNPYIFYSGGR
jgi:GNAT superfamily N-acetyltransferase